MTVGGVDLDSVSVDAVRRALRPVFDRVQGAIRGERVVLVPDVHYPFHPSTGLVTNPDVVEAAVRELGDAASVAVGCAGDGWLEADSVARFLGYEAIAERTGARLVSLDDAPTIRHRGVEVPEPLAEGPVVNLPTVRRTGHLTLAAGAVNVARAVARSAPAAATVGPAVDACPPAVTVLDGTYTYTGAPRKPGVLLAGEDLAAVDAAAAALAGTSLADLPYRGAYGDAPADVDVDVDGLALADLAAALPASDPEASTLSSSLVRRGYRLYARISGDVAPPEVLPDDV
jgi:uncharacterized protein (DUF362 family)